MGYIGKFFYTAYLSSVLGFGVVGCGSQKDLESSDLKVTNGRLAQAQEFPSVVLLVMLTAEGQSICTGTFVNDSQVLTAGHCVEGLDPRKPVLFYGKEVNGEIQTAVQAISFQRHPDYDIRLGVSPVDISVINFPSRTAPGRAQLATRAPLRGDALTIVGYGNNENYLDDQGQQDGTGAGTRRVGTNRVAAVESGFINFIGIPGASQEVAAGDLVGSGSGDSGGPLFVAGKLAGVTSGGGLWPSRIGVLADSLYVDLNNDRVKPFLAGSLNPTSL